MIVLILHGAVWHLNPDSQRVKCIAATFVWNSDSNQFKGTFCRKIWTVHV